MLDIAFNKGFDAAAISQIDGVPMTATKIVRRALAVSLLAAPLSLSAASASGPDEFTLEPMGVGSSGAVYSPETYSSGSTIVTQPATDTDGSKFENVNIDDYIVPETNTNTQ